MGISAATLALLELGGSSIKAFGQAKEAEEQAKSLEFNADVTRKQADLVRTASKVNIFRKRKQAKAFASQQQALFAKAGVGFSGSVLDTIEESASNAELDILLEEFNSESQASRLESEALRERSLASSTRSAGKVRAGATLLKAGFQAGKESGFFQKKEE